MKKALILAALFAAPGLAIAGPCTQGNNSHLGDRTNASQAPAQSNNGQGAVANTGNTANQQQGQGLNMAALRNHFPH